MKIIKNKLLFILPLVLAIAFFSPVVFAKAEGNGRANGAEHRSIVETFVQGLLYIAGNEQGGIGEQVKTIADEQNMSKNSVADAIDKINNRSRIRTFLIGTDYKNIGQLRSEMVKTGNQLGQLRGLLGRETNVASGLALQSQIQELEQEQNRISEFLKTNEGKFSIFGWFVRLFNR